MIRTRGNVYYFPTYELAREYARANNWPTNRIIQYQTGWAIQLYRSGPCVGPVTSR